MTVDFTGTTKEFFVAARAALIDAGFATPKLAGYSMPCLERLLNAFAFGEEETRHFVFVVEEGEAKQWSVTVT